MSDKPVSPIVLAKLNLAGRSPDLIKLGGQRI